MLDMTNTPIVQPSAPHYNATRRMLRGQYCFPKTPLPFFRHFAA